MKLEPAVAKYFEKIGRRGGLAKAKALDASVPVAEVESIVSGYFKKIGRKGGLAKSKVKAASSRENGKLGGRPRKQLKPARNMA